MVGVAVGSSIGPHATNHRLAVSSRTAINTIRADLNVIAPSLLNQWPSDT
jgi:hypothetical protein